MSPLAGAALLTAAAGARLAAADTDVTVGNGDPVTGTLASDADSETLRVLVPSGSKLSVTIVGKKSKAGPAPTLTVQPLLPGDVPFDPPPETIRPGAGFRMANYPAAQSGLHAFRITGNRAGDYTFKASWKGPSGVQVETVPELPPDGEGIASFSADAGSLVSVLVEAAQDSGSRPRILRIGGDSAGGDPWISQDFTFPANTQAAGHQVSKVRLGGSGGNYTVFVKELSATPGPFDVKVTVTPRRTRPRASDLTAKRTGSDPVNDHARGAVVAAEGGTIEIGLEDLSPMDGAKVVLPPGTLAAPTAISITTSPPMVVKGNVRAEGPAVSFGPPGFGLRKVPGDTSRVTVPFDPAPFFGDFASLQVFARQGAGRPALVKPATSYQVDAINGTVTIPVTKLKTFQVFGAGRASRCDVNGDGIDDLAVGAPAAEDGEGRVLVWFGRAAFPALTASPAPDRVLAGEAGDTSFGRAVSVGDVNGDGFADIAVGLVRASAGPAGRVMVFFGSRTFPGGTSDALLSGGIHDDLSFGSVLTTGDVTGDRVPDLVVGAPGATFLAAGEGRVTIFKGRTTFDSSSPDDSAAITLRGGVAGRGLGCSLATGRLNSDAFGDLVVGAVTGPAGPDSGQAYFVAGGQFLASNTVASVGVAFSGDLEGDRFGAAVAIADVDFDGKADLIVGAPGYDTFSPVLGDLPESGAAFVFRGPTFAAASASAASLRLGGEAVMGERRGAHIVGGNFLGTYARDVLFGAPSRSDDPLAGNGAAFLRRASRQPEIVELPVIGEDDGGGFGRILPGADLNGDGRLDPVIAAPGAGAGAGTVTIFFGPRGFSSRSIVLGGQPDYRLGE